MYANIFIGRQRTTEVLVFKMGVKKLDFQCEFEFYVRISQEIDGVAFGYSCQSPCVKQFLFRGLGFSNSLLAFSF